MLGFCEFHRRYAMSATRKPPGSADEPDQAPDGSPNEFPPVPDEDGPHDVPDEKVIEKTMPTKPLPDDGGGRPS
jgi:hypothetical protein